MQLPAAHCSSSTASRQFPTLRTKPRKDPPAYLVAALWHQEAMEEEGRKPLGWGSWQQPKETRGWGTQSSLGGDREL